MMRSECGIDYLLRFDPGSKVRLWPPVLTDRGDETEYTDRLPRVDVEHVLRI
jgi:hypothetical protein